MKAIIIERAGKNENRQLIAVLDEMNRTMYQIWETPERIKKHYEIVKTL